MWIVMETARLTTQIRMERQTATMAVLMMVSKQNHSSAAVASLIPILMMTELQIALIFVLMTL
jgi:hypothetical protein